MFVGFAIFVGWSERRRGSSLRVYYRTRQMTVCGGGVFCRFVVNRSKSLGFSRLFLQTLLGQKQRAKEVRERWQCCRPIPIMYDCGGDKFPNRACPLTILCLACLLNGCRLTLRYQPSHPVRWPFSLVHS